ncbi:MAG: hypothetical protein F6K37_25415 [Moorea sp. SIO4E2]|uniref:hypothetical protein n=1 Tax=Moorena sp. SIO4E2 TaxID=2607826 RepID=UPI0013BDC01B|nr:hypothetical protein [Moorena sp. SIO4E2]NEQ09160.1 hypothetical protein [Moorena sp. SIO4E2]
MVSIQLSAFSYQHSAISYQLSAFSYQLSANALLEVLLNKISCSRSVSLGLGLWPRLAYGHAARTRMATLGLWPRCANANG